MINTYLKEENKMSRRGVLVSWGQKALSIRSIMRTSLTPTAMASSFRWAEESNFGGTSLVEAKRFVGPRQYSPKGLREAAARAPMTFEFGEECNNLAKTAHQTRNYGDAISLYDRCLAMRREKYGPIHTECAATLHNIGRVFLDMKEFGAAENAFTEAAAIYEKLEGPQSLRYAESLELLALAYTQLKFLPEAEKAFKDSISIFRERCYNHAKNSWIPDEPSPSEDPQKHPLASAAHALADCATLFLMQQQENNAIAFLEEALEIRRYLYSRHHKYRPMIAQTLNKLAELRKTINDGTGAEMYINESIDICVETFGRDHPATAHALSSKAGLLAAKKQFREALRLYTESSSTYASVLGKDAPLYGQELVKLARIHELCDEYEQAEKTYEKGLEVVTKAFGPDSLPVAEAMTFMGSLFVKRLRIDKGVELFRNAIRIREDKDRADPQLAFLYQKLGDAYASRLDSQAEAYFLLAIEAYRRNALIEPMQRTFMTDVLDDLGLFYLEFQHFEKAEKCLKESLDARIELLGENHATVAYSYSNFALLYLYKKEYEQCEKMCYSALDMYAKTAKSNVLAQADVHVNLGQCLFAQKKYQEALNWHEKALNARRTRGDSTETAVAESLNFIARIYVEQKKYGLAHKFVKEAERLATQFDAQLTQRLRSEISKTISSIPPQSEWTQQDVTDSGLPQLASSASL